PVGRAVVPRLAAGRPTTPRWAACTAGAGVGALPSPAPHPRPTCAACAGCRLLAGIGPLLTRVIRDGPAVARPRASADRRHTWSLLSFAATPLSAAPGRDARRAFATRFADGPGLGVASRGGRRHWGPAHQGGWGNT